MHLGAQCVQRKNTQEQEDWTDRDYSQSLSGNTLPKGLLPRPPGLRQRDRHRHTHKQKHAQRHTHSDTDGTRKTRADILYEKVLVRCRHDMRRRRGLGKQSLLRSWVLETRMSCRPQGERHQDCEEAGVRGALNPWVSLGLPWKQQGQAGWAF